MITPTRSQNNSFSTLSVANAICPPFLVITCNVLPRGTKASTISSNLKTNLMVNESTEVGVFCIQKIHEIRKQPDHLRESVKHSQAGWILTSVDQIHSRMGHSQIMSIRILSSTLLTKSEDARGHHGHSFDIDLLLLEGGGAIQTLH